MEDFENFLEAESRVIGALLQENSILAELDLSPMDFCDRSYGQIFSAIRQLDHDKKPFDVFTVADELTRTTGKDWIQCLASLARDCPTTKNTVVHAEYVKKYRRNREVREIAEELLDKVARDPGVVDVAISRLMQLNDIHNTTRYTMQQAAGKSYNRICELHSNPGSLLGITTGLKDLDECLGGYQRGDLCVIGARPAMGKTALLLNCAIAAKVPAGIQSAEMTAEQVAQRSLSAVGSINSWSIRTADLSEEEWDRINYAFRKLVEMPIYIDEQPAPTILEVQRYARMLKQKHDIKIFYLDYLQRICGTNPRASTTEQVTEVAKGLKTLAKELDIPVVALAQVNRNVEQRVNKRPGMSDLSDASQIEKESDEIIMLYRDEVYDPETNDKGIAEVNVVKNRHGPTGSVKVAWNGPFLRFSDLSPWGQYD